MTKKDFEAFATMIREYADDYDLNIEQRSDLAERTAHIFERANPRFDRVRFIEACRKERK